MNASTQLVQTTTADKLILSGLFAKGDTNKPAVIFIHGFTSDFYTHPFYHVIADAIIAQNQAIVLAQHRGTGIETEVTKTDGTFEYIGSYFEKLEEAHLDISAWIEFLKRAGYSKFILIGHSLGTIKAVRYLTEGSYKHHIKQLVLLAPFDKNAYVEKKTKGEWVKHLEIAKSMIDAGKGRERIPPTFDDYPVSYATYYSWYHINDFGRMFDFYDKSYTFPVLNQITIPVKVIVGDKDPFFYIPDFNSSPEEVFEILKKNLKDCQTYLVANCGHGYEDKEAEVAREVVNFLEKTI